LNGADDVQRGAVQVREQRIVDDAVERVVVRVAVQEVHRSVEHAKQRVEVVGHHDDGDSEGAVEPVEQRDHLALVAKVEIRQRLVQQQQFRLADQRLSDGDALPLPARQRREPLVDDLEGIDGAHGVLDPLPLGGCGAAESPAGAGQAQGDHVACAQCAAGGGGVVLGDVGDRVGLTRQLSEDPHRAARYRQQPEQHLQQGGLARAVRADHRGESAGGDGEGAL